MWFRQEISLDDSNIDKENYFLLVDVKLLLETVTLNVLLPSVVFHNKI